MDPETQDSPPRPPARAGRDLTTGSIPRHLVAFSLPMLAGSALQTAYGFVNAFWVGRFLGAKDLAAITVSQPVIFVTIAAAAGLTLAANILVAQYFGAKHWERLQRIVQTSFVLVTGVSFLLLALGLLFAGHVLNAINTPPDIFAAALGYLRIVLWTLPLSFAIFLISSLLRGIGDSKTPVYFQTVALLINAALDPVLMFGWFGLPRLGLNGTAWATIVAQAAAVVALLLYVPTRRPLVAPDWRRPQVDWPTAWTLFRIGAPSMLQQSVVSVSMLGIVRLVSAFGSLTDAAFGAGLRIDSVAFMPAITFGMAVSTLAGQNLGAGRPARVREVFWWGLLCSGGVSLAITVATLCFPGFLLRAFLTDPGTVALGVGYLRIVAFTYVLYAVMFVSHGVINGAGHTLATTAVSVVALLAIRLPLSAALSHHHGPRGIWIGMLTSVACGMLLSLSYYASGLWRKSVVEGDATR